MPQVKPVPDGMHTATPHLVCAGAADAIEFYKKAFNATEVGRMAGPQGKLIHAMIRIGDSAVMLIDEFPDWCSLGPKSLKGSPVTIHLYVEDVDAFASSSFVVEFQGGESLLDYPMVKRVIAGIESGKGDRVVSYRLVSNLSHMTKRRFDELCDLGVQIATSLDGPKDLHDRQRRLAGGSSYDSVIKWIKHAQEAGCRIEAMPTITKYSLGREKEIIDEYVKLSLPSVTMRPVSCIGAAEKNWKSVGITAEEYFGFWTNSLDYCMKLWSSKKRMIEGSTVTILEKLLTNGCGSMCARSPCGAGINQLAYDPDGRIFICDLARIFDEFSVGDAGKTPYPEVMKKTAHLRGLCNLTSLCDACPWSPFCGTCLVSSYSAQNNPVPIKPQDFSCRLNS